MTSPLGDSERERHPVSFCPKREKRKKKRKGRERREQRSVMTLTRAAVKTLPLVEETQEEEHSSQ